MRILLRVLILIELYEMSRDRILGKFFILESLQRNIIVNGRAFFDLHAIIWTLRLVLRDNATLNIRVFNFECIIFAHRFVVQSTYIVPHNLIACRGWFS